MNYLKRKMSPLHQGRSRRAEWRGPGPETCRVTVYRGMTLLSPDCGSQVASWAHPTTSPQASHIQSLPDTSEHAWSIYYPHRDHTATVDPSAALLLGAPNLTADLPKPLLMGIPGKHLTPLSLL